MISQDKLPKYRGLESWPEDLDAIPSEQQALVDDIRDRVAQMRQDTLAAVGSDSGDASDERQLPDDVEFSDAASNGEDSSESSQSD